MIKRCRKTIESSQKQQRDGRIRNRESCDRVLPNLTFPTKGTISVNELLSSGAWRSPDAISFHEFRSSVRKPIDFHSATCVFILFYRRKLQSYYQIALFIESKRVSFEFVRYKYYIIIHRCVMYLIEKINL